jgi:SAM-dependent methyltransferase
MTTRDRDYVLGTHDDEIVRLGLHVVAVDRSRRFLDVLEARCDARGFTNISVIESDLDDVAFDSAMADGAWCRWVLAFVRKPRELLMRVAKALKPGGTFVSHEYFDYAIWRTLPRSTDFDEFVTATIGNWRKSGGEPDIGVEVPRWLEELDFEIVSIKPIVYVISREDFMWHWPASFMEIGLKRLVELGAVSHERAPDLQRSLDAIVASPNTRMITPGVLEVIGRKN